jgi:transposase-like protein
MVIEPVPPLDCFRLLQEMAEAGVSNKEVARRLGKPPSTIEGWKAGAQPSWSEGQRLLQIHAYVMSDIRKGVSD